MTKNWTLADIECGPETADHLAGELAEIFGVSVEHIAGGVRIYFESSRFPGEEARLRETVEAVSSLYPAEGRPGLRISEIPDEDWSETWKAHFKPLQVGSHFLVTPTWETVNPAPADRVIRIDPGRAFGTGHHETTRLCLEWLERSVDCLSPGLAPGTLLDVGTGSGILAIGAALLGFQQVVGIDNDPEAIEVALENIALNGLSGRIRAFCATPRDVDGAFDVVISNIQSMPLIAMAGTLASKLSEGGRLGLSGILTEQAEDVRNEYEKRSLRLTERQTAGEWVLLAFEK